MLFEINHALPDLRSFYSLSFYYLHFTLWLQSVYLLFVLTFQGTSPFLLAVYLICLSLTFPTHFTNFGSWFCFFLFSPLDTTKWISVQHSIQKNGQLRNDTIRKLLRTSLRRMQWTMTMTNPCNESNTAKSIWNNIDLLSVMARTADIQVRARRGNTTQELQRDALNSDREGEKPAATTTL